MLICKRRHLVIYFEAERGIYYGFDFEGVEERPVMSQLEHFPGKPNEGWPYEQFLLFSKMNAVGMFQLIHHEDTFQ